MRYTLVFGVLGTYLAVTAYLVQGLGWLLLWPGVSFLVLAAAYAGLGPRVYGKRADGRMAWWARPGCGPVPPGAGGGGPGGPPPPGCRRPGPPPRGGRGPPPAAPPRAPAPTRPSGGCGGGSAVRPGPPPQRPPPRNDPLPLVE